jgi:hypothetical protein
MEGPNMFLVLLTYFIAGLSGISNLAGTFFLKESLPNLSAAELVNLGLLAGLPWSLKILFGLALDKSKATYERWILYGLLVSITVTLGTYYFAVNVEILAPSAFLWLGALNVLGASGAVMQDLAADTLAVSVYSDSKKTSRLQVHSRIATVLGGVIGAALSGPVAAHYSRPTALLLPILLYIAALPFALLFRYPHVEKHLSKSEVGLPIFMYSAIYLVGVFAFANNPVVIFFLSAGYFYGLLRAAKIPALPKTVVYSSLGLFLLRLMPGAGPGLTWFYIDVLKFDEHLLGRMNLLSNVAGLIGSVVFGWTLHKLGAFKAAVWTTIALLLISLPDPLVFYGWKHALATGGPILPFGLEPQQLIILAAEVTAPLANFMMVILGVIIARNTPKEGKAIYMSLTASLMNLALTGGDALTWILNKLWIIQRGDYTNLGIVLTVGILFSSVLNIFGLIYLKKGDN